MLKKLIKYDLISIFKFLIIFYSIGMFFAIMTRLFFSFDNSFIMNIIGQICSGVTISMIFNILINNIMRLWVRFKNNFYGDESYLTHTLPVEKKDLYLSKISTSFISLFTSVFVIGLMLFVAYYSKENMLLLKNMLLPLAEIYDTTLISIIIMILFVFFLEVFNGLQAGFTGIILGYKMNNNKTGLSILFGFISYGVTQIMVLIILFIFALFNSDIMNLFKTVEIINVDTIKLIIYFAIIIYSITLIINYFVNQYLFKKGVNVE